MVHFGIIPFLHHTYDTQHNLKNIPEFLRCKNADDFKTKVNFLESNKQAMEKLQQDLYKIYPTEGYYDGHIFINKIYERFQNTNNF